MSKKHFIALAKAIIEHDRVYMARGQSELRFQEEHLETLAAFCSSVNPRFLTGRWLGFIEGVNGPNGGSIKAAETSRKGVAVYA